MQGVDRGYQHSDFSYLLRQEPIQPIQGAKKKTKKQTVTPEKRRRDSLMSNRNMRFVISDTGKVHDRDCRHVAQIPDDVFEMCSEFPEKRPVCFACYRKMLVRSALDLDLTKYIEAAMGVFARVKATNSELKLLLYIHKATIFKVKADCVYLHLNEDKWIVQEVGGRCRLYHNNYQVFDGNKRMMQEGYHEQISRSISFREALITMCQYTWGGHMQHVEEKQRALRQQALSVRLDAVNNYRYIPRASLLFQYFEVAAPLDGAPVLPCRVLRRDIYENGAILHCRVPKWKAKAIQKIARAMKAVCVGLLQEDYEQFCMTYFIGEEEL